MKRYKIHPKKILKGLYTLALAVILFGGATGLMTVHASASSESARMNVVLVIDGSGSLTYKETATDPKGLRYDAIDLFLALLTNQGNNVGAIVFNEGNDSFRLYSAIDEISGKSDKLALSDAIRKAGAGGDTNIGAALLKAVEEAAEMSNINGQDSVIILFSDGRTDVKGEEAYQQSLDAKEQATVLAQDSDIPVYTICLKANDIADPQEMQEIAERTSGAFVAVDDAEDLTAAFEAFYSLIFASAGSEIQEASYPDNGVLSFEIPIPTYGAEEVNIILNTTDLKSTAVYSPTGTLSKERLDEYTMSGGYYDVIKLVDPECGQWMVELTGVPQERVTINVLYNIDSTVQLCTAEGTSDYKTGERVTFEANLLKGGKPVTDDAVTSEYSAVLHLTNKADGKTKEIPMVAGNNGTFVYEMKAEEYTSYHATAYLNYGHLSLESNELSVNFDNTAPAVSPSYLEIKAVVTPISGRSRSFNLTDYFSDAQDSELTYSIVSSQLVKDTVKLDGETGALQVNTAACRSGELILQAADSQGATTQMTIRFRITNLTGVIFGVIAAGVIFGLIAVAAVVYAATHKPWHGMISVRNLANGIEMTHGSFRGSLPLKAFGLAGCRPDGKFVVARTNQLEFVSSKSVYIFPTAPDGTKRVPLIGGNCTIYADKSQTVGIRVDVRPTHVRGGKFGGATGGGTARSGRRNKNAAPTHNGPFA